MFSEFELSKRMILELTAMPELMENNPQIRESIRLRADCVAPDYRTAICFDEPSFGQGQGT